MNKQKKKYIICHKMELTIKDNKVGYDRDQNKTRNLNYSTMSNFEKIASRKRKYIKWFESRTVSV